MPGMNSTGTRTGKPEILAPAGSREALLAALAAGADAVYLGLDEGFNARARAANFPLAELPATVADVHAAGARIYVTLNTLVFEPELARVEQLLRDVARSGADAIIVQDPAVAMLAREICPALHVHASTQMTVSTAAAARFAADLSITRVVVPRELSVDEIRAFAQATALELEVFIHGALCVSWSGQCLTSEAWSGRSANRGECAQSCRMPYSLQVDGARRDLGDVRYLLSPKDLAGARALPALLDLGIHGLKIEGRQKGAQYVGTAVRGYRRFVDRILATATVDDHATRDLQRDLLDMTLSYSRGFSDGFFGGADHQTLVEGRFPKHRGVCIGSVVAVTRDVVRVRPDPHGRPWTGGLAADEPASAPRGSIAAQLAPLGAPTDASAGPAAAPLCVTRGMGVVFDAGDPEDRAEPGGPVFDVHQHGDELWLEFGRPGPDLSRVTAGQRVWVTGDPALARDVDRTLKRAPPSGGIRVDLLVHGQLGMPLIAAATLPRGATIRVSSTLALQPARGDGIDAALLRDKLGALGGTPFLLGSLDAAGVGAGLHLPVSALKGLRRALVDALTDAMRQPRTVMESSVLPALRSRLAAGIAPLPASNDPTLIPLCRTQPQLDAAIAHGCREVELDWMELVGLRRACEQARAAGLRVTLATLRIQKPGEDEYLRAVRALRPDAILVRHLGGLMELADDPSAPPLHGDFSLNVTNSITAQHLLARGLSSVTAAFDLDETQLRALLARSPRGCIAVVIHHRIPAFHTEHCVYAHLLSAGRDYRTCGRPCEHHEVALADDRGRVLPVIVDAGCRNTVFNAEAQSAARLVAELRAAGVRRFRVELVRESAAETTRVLAAYQRLLDGSLSAADLLRELGVKAHLGVSKKAMQLLQGS